MFSSSSSRPDLPLPLTAPSELRLYTESSALTLRVIIRQWTVDTAVPVDEVHLLHDIVHLQSGEGLSDEVLAPDGDLGVLVAPVSEAADNSSWCGGKVQAQLIRAS